MLRIVNILIRSRCPRALLLGLAISSVLGATAPSQAGLVIHRTFIGGTPPADIAGGGDLVTIFNEAADLWEKIFSDPNQQWTLDLRFGWDALSPPAVGLHAKCKDPTAGGNPKRVLSATIVFNNAEYTSWFADPNPGNNSAFADVRPDGGEYSLPSNPDGVFLNYAIRFLNPVNGDAVDRIDLFTLAMHEIGHSLGMTVWPPVYEFGFPIHITSDVSPRYAGMEVYGFQDHIHPLALMGPYFDPGVRRYPSTLDILAIAALAHYENPNWFPSLELLVNGLRVSPGNKNSMLAKLRNSQAHINAGNLKAARNQLNAFINEVTANAGERLTQDEVDSLVAMAETAIAGL